MNNYVLGFAFTLDNRVALIKKLKPEWQSGLLNGIGGKRELVQVEGIYALEPAIFAMRREFREETGVDISFDDWTEVGIINGNDFHITVFTTVHEDIYDVKTVESEEIFLLPLDSVKYETTVENAIFCIHACILKLISQDTVKFELKYS